MKKAGLRLVWSRWAVGDGGERGQTEGGKDTGRLS